MMEITLPSLNREVLGSGPEDASILILTDAPTYNDRDAKMLLSDYAGKLLTNQFLKAGVLRRNIRFESIAQIVAPGNKFFLFDRDTQSQWKFDCLERLEKLKPNIIVGLGEEALRLLTDKSSISKWHLSIIPSALGPKCINLIHPANILRIFKDIPYLTFGCQRAVEESRFAEIRQKTRDFTLNPTLDEFEHWIEHNQNAEFTSIDIETASGQITCIGFSTDPGSAICIPTKLSDYTPDFWYLLWSLIERVCQNDSKKVGQNFLYDQTYLSRYGIRVRNFYHDTMACQKFLNPELKAGLDNIARLYTTEPYWKEEGKNWTERQDIEQLWRYNCKDTSVTLEAVFAQRVELKKKGLMDLFYGQSNFGTQVDFGVMRFAAPATEMCWTGLPIDRAERDKLKTETEIEIKRQEILLDMESEKVLGKSTNSKSPLQVKELLKGLGYRIPVKKGSETSDKKALKKLQLRYTNCKVLPILIRLSKENKKLSSYLNYGLYPDSRLRSSMRIHGTETGRWAGGLDPWQMGINIQTVPREGWKSQVVAPKGKVLISIDLKQAESRFVAWDGPVPKLQELYNSGVDVHKFVASNIFHKLMVEISKTERFLGKKSGHAANYGVGGYTFAEACLDEAGLVIDPRQAEKMIQDYHQLFDNEVLNWQAKVRNLVRQDRMLITPFGRQRQFWDRIGDDLFREAYAYRPQSTIPDIINHLMLWIWRQPGVTLLNQTHDGLWLEVDEARETDVINRIKDQDAWNPKLELAGGTLRIPIEVERGKCLETLQTVYDG